MTDHSEVSHIDKPALHVAKDTAVQIAYILRDSDNQIIDQASAKDGFVYLHGHDNIVPGLEKALNGLEVGAKVSVSLTPAQGYGDYDPALIRKVPKAEFSAKFRNPEPGQMIQIEEDGFWRVFTVTAVYFTHISMDGNHELAGKELHFEVEIIDIRPATADEIQHGHAHSPGDEGHS